MSKLEPNEAAQLTAKGDKLMIGEYRADYAQLTPEEIAHDEPELVELYANSEERRCQKCGRPTKGEEAWIDGQYWCHPCADALA